MTDSCFSVFLMKMQVKMKYIGSRVFSWVMVLAVSLMMSCSEDTGSIGIPPANETLKTDIAFWDVYSSTMRLDSIRAYSTSSYLGSIYDPETNG